MRWFATLAVVAALVGPTTASGQYTFGDWAGDSGYTPGDVMPWQVGAGHSSIDSLDGIGEFDWTTTPTTELRLYDNQLTSIEPGDFSSLTNLTELNLDSNEIVSIERVFSASLQNFWRRGRRIVTGGHTRPGLKVLPAEWIAPISRSQQAASAGIGTPSSVSR